MLEEHSQPPSKSWDASLDHMEAMLEGLDWDQIWEDASLRSVCHYLRGSKDLRLPPEIRALIPQAI